MALTARILPRYPKSITVTGGLTKSEANGVVALGFDYAQSELGAELTAAIDTVTTAASTVSADAATASSAATAAAASAVTAASFTPSDFVIAGTGHAHGLVPDPGATPETRVLTDGGWARIRPFERVYDADEIGFVCDGGGTDNAPIWDDFMASMQSRPVGENVSIMFPTATDFYGFNTRPMVPVAPYLTAEGAPTTAFVRLYQPGLKLAIANISPGASNGAGGSLTRITLHSAHGLSSGVGVVGIYGVATGPIEANGMWSFTVVNSTTIDLSIEQSSGLISIASGGTYVTDQGTLLTAPMEPFIQQGKNSGSDPFPQTSRLNNLTILSGNGTYGGIGLDLGSVGNPSDGTGAAYNCRDESLFISISGVSDWWISCRVDGSANGGHVSFKGARDNKIMNSAIYEGLYMGLLVKSTVAFRGPNVEILAAGTNSIRSSLALTGTSSLPSYGTHITGSQCGTIRLDPYATLALIQYASVETAVCHALSTGNTIEAYCNGATPIVEGTNNRVISGAGIFTSNAMTINTAGVQVLGGQGGAVADATDAATAITQLNAIIARLRAHGLIAT